MGLLYEWLVVHQIHNGLIEALHKYAVTQSTKRNNYISILSSLVTTNLLSSQPRYSHALCSP